MQNQLKNGTVGQPGFEVSVRRRAILWPAPLLIAGSIYLSTWSRSAVSAANLGSR